MVTAKCFLVTTAGEIPLRRLRAIPQVVEIVPLEESSTEGKALPLEVRLRRQRQIIHARRGELKRFLNPRPLRCVPGGAAARPL